MTKFAVLYVEPSDTQRETIQLAGFNTELGKTYFDLTMPFGEIQFDRAVQFDLYKPAAVLDVPDIEDTFGELQNLDAGWNENEAIDCLTAFPRSMSTGDIVVNLETREIFYCASIGFKPVTGEPETLARLDAIGKAAQFEHLHRRASTELRK